MGEGCVALSMHPEEYPPCKDCEQTAYKPLHTLLCACTEQLCMQTHRANADLSTALKCLASAKKSIKRLNPSENSALELLLVC